MLTGRGFQDVRNGTYMCVEQKGPSGGGEKKQTLEVCVTCSVSGGGFLGNVWT